MRAATATLILPSLAGICAAHYAYNREVCGDHYHSDIEASRALGAALVQMFLENAALKPKLDAARAELRAAHLTEKGL